MSSGNNKQSPSSAGGEDTAAIAPPAQSGLSIAAAVAPAFEAHVAVEHAALGQQLHFDESHVSFLGIYRFADTVDVLVVTISALCAVIAGALIPITPIISSRIIKAFSKAEGHDQDAETLLNRYTLYYAYIVLVALVTWFIATAGFNYTGARIARRIKIRFFAATLKQNMAIFDDNGIGGILSQLTDDANAVQNAISSKLSQTIAALGTLVATVAVCFAVDAILMLELIWSLFVGYVVLYLGGVLTVRYSTRSIEASSSGSGVIEEAFSSIKTTTSLGIQKYVHDTYMNFLKQSAKYGFFITTINGILIAICVTTGYVNVALAFWQGARRITEGSSSFTAVVTIAMVSKAAAFCVLGVGANVEAFSLAVAGARRLTRMIKRISPIDSSSDQGLAPNNFSPVIELHNLRHIYPCRPATTVLDNVNIKFPAGKTTALVGHSGSGKSSIAHLLLRFYDPLSGSIVLDGRNLTDYNIGWLRQQMAVVKQEPFMFNKSVFENIELGFTGNRGRHLSPPERRKAVEQAARVAQASEFIDKLPQGYDTIVGSRGSRLSGGQLQRIAIARALVNTPRILILDEATSALDSETEARLLATMAESDRQQTTIVIAHRLSTIRHADNIIVLDAGRVVESGKHDDLMAAESHYFRLVKAQDQDHDKQDPFDDAYEYRPSTDGVAEQGIEHAPEVLGPEGDRSATSTSIWSMILFMIRLSKRQSHWMIIGLLGSIIAGGEEAVSAVLFGKVITALARPLDEADNIRSDAAFYAWMFLLLALIMLISNVAEGVAFAIVAQHLSNRVRDLTLDHYLKMDISFFDKEENSFGAISGFLSGSAGDITGLSGSALGIILICFSTVVSGIVISFALGWKLALVCFAVMPLMVGGGYFGVLLVADFEEMNETFAHQAAEFAGETLAGIQTIAALTREEESLHIFQDILGANESKAFISNLKVSFLYALTQTAYYACMAVSFWYGGRLILRGEYTLFQAITIQSAMLLSAFSAGLVFAWTPNIGKAKQAAASLQRLLAQKSEIDPSSVAGTDPGAIEGHVQFSSVSFAYPSRPDNLALDNVSFTIPAGANIAFVGTTGSGKSTIVSLIERFYDPLKGSILVDSKPVTSLQLSKYRSCIGLVSQVPNLYRGTIRDNLVLGIDDDAKVSDEEIKQACEEAFIYEFISSLPDGLNTEVGSKGVQLSIGQKQRIVLARTLLRKPTILLLDEATSALDSQSESIIQEALEKMKRARTTITIAHRLSTIVKADKIYVLSDGRIVESGTHAQLMARKADYYRLYVASKSGQAL
ncbi:multidrug resistance protein [Cordyceps militaris CM01]|uniref:Multidrug resistance protein n=1 Tax=Cordyceps militaris (strain CM01) TaxID=983644 RepID=G3J555_CORMM|nr:multidrug resistance protein [Cordyceps militaris CM01]EGX95969.1 multidrug resistance protein [Cordyceps militaris CM01]